ncbi:hypothetical protein J4446_00040 [Candidatus Woesearchaeota archaeon]|nr:hypothetical protein [Candidatus Woesearchaeota archaeon]
MRKKRNVGLIYFIAFSFLALCIFGGLGFYNGNTITTAAINTGVISDSISNSIQIMTNGLIKPIFGEITGGSSDIIIRFILWIILFSIISGILTKDNKKFNKTTANIIAALIPLIAVAFLPGRFIAALGPIGAFILVLGLIIFGFRWIYNFMKDNHDWFSKTIRVLLSFLMIIFLTIMTPWFEDIFQDNIGELYYLAIGLGVLFGFISIFYFLSQGRSHSGTGYTSGSGGSPTTSSGGGSPIPPSGGSTTSTIPLVRSNTIKNIRSYYARILIANRNIEKEFKNTTLDLKKLTDNLEDMEKSSRSIISFVNRDPSLNGTPLGKNIIILSIGINGGINNCLSFIKSKKSLTSGELKSLISLYYSRVGPNIMGIKAPISGL